MDEITFEDAIQVALGSLLASRLTILAGAGVSMDPPSSLPSAANIAELAKQKYDSTYGTSRPPLPLEIEAQAQFFFDRGELDSVYFKTLIDEHAFAGPPNSGHYAIADLLLVGAFQTAITTNVDSLIETAGQLLYGQVGFGIDSQIAALPPLTRPLLKIHGCRSCDPANMVWAPGQLSEAPVSNRIAFSEQWLGVRLLHRDLLVVGYWTDWDYLNSVLANTLGGVTPARVIVVNPMAGADLPTKAPALAALGTRATVAFTHVQTFGAKFLDRLRLEFGRSFLRRVLHSGAESYHEERGVPPNNAWLEPPVADNDALWHIRRDLEGCLPGRPALITTPPQESFLGLTLLRLIAGGATLDGPYWDVSGRRVRVLRTPNKPLHRVEADYQGDIPPVAPPDLVIAVGAEALALPKSIARATGAATIARGASTLWRTRADGLAELAL